MPLRYVILHHTGVVEPHYDLMFEPAPDLPLKTFRCSCWPIMKPTELTPLADHRRHYLTYEGPLTGGRGSVRRVEAGHYTASPGWLYEPRPILLELHPSGTRFTLRLTPAASLAPCSDADSPAGTEKHRNHG